MRRDELGEAAGLCDVHVAGAVTVGRAGEQLAPMAEMAAGCFDGSSADAPPVTYRVDVGDASQCILDAARRADVVVMSTSGRSGLKHLLIGSVAEKIVRHSTVPVLTIRVPEKPARAAKD